MQLIIHSQTGINRISADKIIRIEALGNYSKIYLVYSNPLVVSKVLTWCQEKLPEDMFARVHRSHLVNKSYVTKISDGEHKTILMSNGDIIAVSRRSATYTLRTLKEINTATKIAS
ncbi:MAG: LytTR family DNA-binding domain-containing protein [Bacteroidota bacterium]